MSNTESGNINSLPWSVAFVVAVAITSVTVALSIGRDINSLVTFLGLILIQGGILYRVERVRGDTKEILNGGMETKVRDVLQDVLEKRDKEWQAASDKEALERRPGI